MGAKMWYDILNARENQWPLHIHRRSVQGTYHQSINAVSFHGRNERLATSLSPENQRKSTVPPVETHGISSNSYQTDHKILMFK
jgi:hypothetical protein